jgi:long-chain acyl-CoA synthetase
LVAVVVPDEEPVMAWVAKQNDDSLAKRSFQELCQSSQLNEAIMSDIKRLSSEKGLHGFEIPKAVHLESSLFTAENDLVTPTFKLKRDKLKGKYERQIADMYGKLPAPKSKL